ncbi:MAG: ADP-ribosylglycohydrolase [Cycloclasticus sp. symbiont of Poecilosclerida sp. M]|nr:MAG: ADP-ribosylglycohydrolase [Cycloclasticus sp. symbiont of Poecilosclerida sp. M]
MSNISIEDRATGAIIGAYIGDALGLGPHWYYDLEEQHQHYGEWISDYTNPQPDRYHGGMKAGQSSQSGNILSMLIDSLLTAGEYDESDFCSRLDNGLFPLLDGTPNIGPGNFTNQSIREAWALRTQQNKSWGELAGYADNTEAAERTLALAVRYATCPEKLAKAISSNTHLTQCDENVHSTTVVYGAALSLLIQGHPLDVELSDKLLNLFSNDNQPCQRRTPYETPSNIAQAARENLIQPVWKVSRVYGMSCAVNYQFPACYYLASRFSDDFESAVLHAINGGGQNMARAMLTGALVGAQVGIQGIPERFIGGLENSTELLNRAKKLAASIS